MLTIKEAAMRLGISPSAVRKLINQGKLPHYRPCPAAIRLKETDVDAYLESTRCDIEPVMTEEVKAMMESVGIRIPARGGWGR